MNFDEYIQQAWIEHTTDANKVVDEIKDNFKLMKTEDDVMSIARLIVHVCGEHLGDWEKGIALLKKLKNNAAIKDKNEMNRNMAILNLGNFPNTNIDTFSPSDKVIIYSKTASALANLGGTKNADKFFHLACEIADENLEQNDSIIKTLAITGNNIATSLEEKGNRSSLDDSLMFFAATKARIYWEKVGTWLEVERAEYRLSKTCYKLKNYEQSQVHAENCLRIIDENKAPPLEAFFAYELKCLLHHALKNKEGYLRSLDLMKRELENMPSDEAEWCNDVLKIVENLE